MQEIQESQFKLMEQKDILELKTKLYHINNSMCPLLKTKIPLEKMVLDHIHKLKSESYSEQKGTVRNAIEFRANQLEGKITNAWKRYFGTDESKHPINLPDFLRNLADYLEKGAYSENNTYFVHPTEVPKNPKVSKKSYNKLKKLFINDNNNYKKNVLKKFPDYPSSGKITKSLSALFLKYDIEPYNS